MVESEPAARDVRWPKFNWEIPVNKENPKMKLTLQTSINIGAVGSLLLLTGTANAALLGVDFQNSNGVSVAGVTQAGFVAFDNTHSTGTGGTATYGSFNVTVSGLDALNGTIEGLFNRGGVANGGALTFADIYNDFAFNNSNAPITLQLTGAGITPNTRYNLTFYSFDNLTSEPNTHMVSFTGTAGTTGSPALINTTPASDPTTNGQYASTGTFTSNAAGVLTVQARNVGPIVANWGPRLNAFEIDLAPAAAPGTQALKIDFNDTVAGGGPSPTETGFVSFQEVGSPGARLFATPQGSLMVTVSGHETASVGGFFDRGAPADSGAFTNGELYRDFLFHNSGGTISLAIDGVKAGAVYEMIFYSSDRFDGLTQFASLVTNQFVPILNTTGPTGQVTFDRTITALSNLQHSFTGLFTSTTGTLNFEVRNLAGSQTRLNGFELRELATVPEPATATLSMLALGGLFVRRRRLSEI